DDAKMNKKPHLPVTRFEAIDEESPQSLFGNVRLRVVHGATVFDRLVVGNELVHQVPGNDHERIVGKLSPKRSANLMVNPSAMDVEIPPILAVDQHVAKDVAVQALLAENGCKGQLESLRDLGR